MYVATPAEKVLWQQPMKRCNAAVTKRTAALIFIDDTTDTCGGNQTKQGDEMSY